MAGRVWAEVGGVGSRVTVPRSKWETSQDTSARMRRQPSKGTQPELAIRRALYARGLRYRIHWPVPGRPRRTIDIALPKWKIAVFVDGCFWHGCPTHAVTPKRNSERWTAKISANVARDEETSKHLRGLQWSVIRLWEHEDAELAADRVERLVRDVEARTGRKRREDRPR